MKVLISESSESEEQIDLEIDRIESNIKQKITQWRKEFSPAELAVFHTVLANREETQTVGVAMSKDCNAKDNNLDKYISVLNENYYNEFSRKIIATINDNLPLESAQKEHLQQLKLLLQVMNFFFSNSNFIETLLHYGIKYNAIDSPILSPESFPDEIGLSSDEQQRRLNLLHQTMPIRDQIMAEHIAGIQKAILNTLSKSEATARYIFFNIDTESALDDTPKDDTTPYLLDVVSITPKAMSLDQIVDLIIVRVKEHISEFNSQSFTM